VAFEKSSVHTAQMLASCRSNTRSIRGATINRLLVHCVRRAASREGLHSKRQQREQRGDHVQFDRIKTANGSRGITNSWRCDVPATHRNALTARPADALVWRRVAGRHRSASARTLRP
jgi:hypothetical protein